MTVFLQTWAEYEHYIYALVVLVAVFALRSVFMARRERRSAVFPLEREIALMRLYRTAGLTVLLALVMAGTWSVGHLLLPKLAYGTILTTPTPDILLLIDTPTPTLPPPTATPTTTPTPRPRPTRRPPPPQTTPTPAVLPPACPNPGAALASPGQGQAITGETQVIGTASIPNFQFYKLEWRNAAGPEQWNWFAGSETPVVGGVLGSFNPAGLPPGNYIIRLVVVDNTGNYPNPCTVQVTIPAPG